MGNIRSIQKVFERLKIQVRIVTKSSDLSNSEKIVLPGVGHFTRAMNILNETGFAEAIKEAVLLKKIPILGICLGMQLMTSCSEEGKISGLGLINAKTKKFPPDMGKKIPHMGWNNIQAQKESPLYDGIQHDDLFYFVHSFYVKCKQPEDRLFTTDYGILFDSGFQRHNITGFQFHPEKSHGVGMQLLKNFAGL